jgi:hypothetical protein
MVHVLAGRHSKDIAACMVQQLTPAINCASLLHNNAYSAVDPFILFFRIVFSSYQISGNNTFIHEGVQVHAHQDA